MTAALAIVLGAGSCFFLAGCGAESSDDEGRVVPGEEWEHPGGRWHPVGEGKLTSAQREEIERLRSIGYLPGSTTPPEDSGVVLYEPGAAYDGLNLYTSGHAPTAVLMDMEGNVLHEWHYEFIDAWKAGPRRELPRSPKGAGFWRRVHLFDNGDLLAIFDGKGLIKIDRRSKLLWAYLEGAHHDLDVAEDGRIYVLIREARVDPHVNPEHAVLEDYIAILSPGGEELRRIPLLRAFERSPFSHYLQGMKRAGDIFHTNTIEILDGRLADRLPAFKKGNLLVCVRELDVVAVVDPDGEAVVWAARAPWSRPHQPTVLDNGNILIFDNRGYGGMSRVVEFDAVSFDIKWEYHGTEEEWFYSKECGSNQRLPNGNTLITESDRGRAFEVTPDKRIVWEYVNPAHAGSDNEFIASLFEVVRLDPTFPVGWLDSRE